MKKELLTKRVNYFLLIFLTSLANTNAYFDQFKDFKKFVHLSNSISLIL